MSNHSPGPWRKGGHWIIRDAGAAGLPVCEVWPHGVGDEKAFANENLIVAAPELLCALRSLVAYRGDAPPDVLMRQALDAIAKAEGKA